MNAISTKKLLGAKNRLKDYMPLSVKRYNSLDKAYIKYNRSDDF
jgi:hypothetical protein